MTENKRVVTEWEVIDSGVAEAQTIMAQDRQMLASLAGRTRPILHFYEWKGPSATYGVLVKPEEYLDIKAAQDHGITLARRPTGGGIVFHLWDFAFSVLVPASCPLFAKNTLENYALINRVVLRVVERVLEQSAGHLTPQDGVALEKRCQRFCMAMPTKYDVVIQDKKVAGAAQRQTKDGFLHQGTIALRMPDQKILEDLLGKGSLIIESMLQSTFPLLEGRDRIEGIKQIKEFLTQELT